MYHVHAAVIFRKDLENLVMCSCHLMLVIQIAKHYYYYVEIILWML